MSNASDRDDAVLIDDIGERQADALMRIAAEDAFNQLDPGDPRNVKFFEWYAREARERQTPARRRATEDLARASAARMVRRWQVEALGVREGEGTPRVQRAPVAATIANALELATVEAQAPCVDMAVAAGAGRALWDEECTEWVEVPPDLPPGKHLALRVSGESMTPFLHDGDTLLVKVGTELKPGSVVVARRPDDGYVVKRVGQVRRRSVELVSLNPEFEPIRLPRDPRLLLGTVVLRWCTHGAPG
jgi:phage repressor protein C with HTH and peptisase S24 domain